MEYYTAIENPVPQEHGQDAQMHYDKGRKQDPDTFTLSVKKQPVSRKAQRKHTKMLKVIVWAGEPEFFLPNFLTFYIFLMKI